MKPLTMLKLACCAYVMASVVGLGAEPVLSNRVAKADEIGYRPADGTESDFNPPSLTWLHEAAAVSYTVAWSQKPDFSDAVTVERVPFNTYTHQRTLAPGKYYWRYRFQTRADQLSNWSLTRQFVLTTHAVAFPMPTRAQQRERVPVAHPRLFLRPEDLPRLKSAALGSGEAASTFAKLRANADKLLRGEPAPEPKVRGSIRDESTRDAWWPNRVLTERVCMEAETLAFVYLLTGDSKYGAGARKWVLHLAAWDPDGPTNFKLNCEAAKPMLCRLPRAYDWAYGALSDTDREKVRQVMRRRGQDAWGKRRGRPGSRPPESPLQQPRQSHLSQTRRCARSLSWGKSPKRTHGSITP